MPAKIKNQKVKNFPSVTPTFAPRSGKIGAKPSKKELLKERNSPISFKTIATGGDVRNRRFLKPGVGVQKVVGANPTPATVQGKILANNKIFPAVSAFLHPNSFQIPNSNIQIPINIQFPNSNN